MSQENVDLHYRALDAFNRRDLEALLSLTDASVEIHSRLVAVEGGYHGHEGARRWWANLLETLPDWTIEVLEMRDLGDVTFAGLRTRGHGAGSDIPIDQKIWQVVEWRDKKVVRWTSYETQAEALEAVGLRE